MLAQAAVFLASAAQALALAGCEPEGYLLRFAVAQIQGACRGKGFAPAYHHGVGHAGEAFGEAQVVDGVKQIALPHAVVAEKAVDFWREVKRGFRYVLEVDQCEGTQFHIGAKVQKNPALPEQYGIGRYGK